MKILCLGDSLGLPREMCPYEDTWYYKLAKTYPQHDFIADFQRGMLINEALLRYDLYYRFYKADIVIIQTGICDCSLRFINDKKIYWKISIEIIKRLRMTNVFWATVKKGNRKADCVYTSAQDFALLYNNLIKKMIEEGVKHVMVIKIGHGSEAVVSRSKHFNSNVERYNKIIDNIQDYYPDRVFSIEPLSKVEEDCFIDGYHCSPKGMDAVYREINRVIGRWVPA